MALAEITKVFPIGYISTIFIINASEKIQDFKTIKLWVSETIKSLNKNGKDIREATCGFQQGD